MRTRRWAALLAAAAVTVAAGCGGGDDGGGSSATTVSVRVGDAEVSSDGKGGVTIESGDATATLGSAAAVPDGFPSDVPVPEGTISDAVAGDSGSQKLFNLTVYVDDGAATIDGLAEGLRANGYEVTVGASGEEGGRALNATGPEWTVLATSKTNLKTGEPFVAMLVTSVG